MSSHTSSYPPPSYEPYVQDQASGFFQSMPGSDQSIISPDQPYYNENRGDHVYIALMGVTGAGKSSFIQLCTQQDITVGHNLQSCTTEVEEFSFLYDSNVTVHLVDTPGFDDTNRSDVEVLRDVASWLGTAYKQNVRLSGIIYLHRISDPRLGGSAKRNLGMFKKLCGESCFPKVVLATTFWSQVDEQLGTKREQELVDTEQFWGYMKKRGSAIMRHTGTYVSGMGILQYILSQRQEVVLDIQKETVDQGLNLDDTAAGKSIDEELLKQRQRYEREIHLMQAEKEESLRTRDMETYQEQLKMQQEYEEKIAQIIKDRQSMQVNLETVELDMARKLKQMEDENMAFKEKIQREREEMEKARITDAQARAELEAKMSEYQATQLEVKRQKKGIRGKLTDWVEKRYDWINENPEKAQKVLKVGKTVGKVALHLAAHAASSNSTPANGNPTQQPLFTTQWQPAERPSTSIPRIPSSMPTAPQVIQPILDQPPQMPQQQQQQQQQHFVAPPSQPAARPMYPQNAGSKGPNPLGMPTTGIIGVDIICNPAGQQVAWKIGTIWPGPNIWSRFNDLSWPDDLKRFVKVRDEQTGIEYWARPFSGTVAGGQWVSWR